MKDVKYFPVYMPDCKYGYKYRCAKKISIYSKRYKKWITVDLGFLSDGATSAIDINSDCWWFHDVLCKYGKFDDGSKCTNWQASNILFDIMREEGRSWLRSNRWRWATFLMGGGEARKNGMF